MSRAEVCLVVVRAVRPSDMRGPVDPGEWVRGLVYFHNGGLAGMGKALVGMDWKAPVNETITDWVYSDESMSHVEGKHGLIRNPCPEPEEDYEGKHETPWYPLKGDRGVLTARMKGTSGLSFGIVVPDPQGRRTIPRIRHIYLYDPNFPGQWFYRGFDLPDQKDTFTPLTERVLKESQGSLRDKAKTLGFAPPHTSITFPEGGTKGVAGEITKSVSGLTMQDLLDLEARIHTMWKEPAEAAQPPKILIDDIYDPAQRGRGMGQMIRFYGSGLISSQSLALTAGIAGIDPTDKGGTSDSWRRDDGTDEG